MNARVLISQDFVLEIDTRRLLCQSKASRTETFQQSTILTKKTTLSRSIKYPTMLRTNSLCGMDLLVAQKNQKSTGAALN